MDLEQKFQLVRGIGEECIKDDELRNLLEEKPDPICYDGFEPSGRMHIAQGIMKAINVNKLTSAGCRVKIWIADWFAHMNNKMGGDLEKIEVVGKYFIEIWKALGMDIEGGSVEFLWSSEEIVSRVQEYLPLMIDISRRNTLNRIIKCGQIMGRSDQDELSAAQIFYPCMQCADVFFLKADICQLGMDQRKVNTLALDYCDKIKRENKPIILSHHMLPGLKKGQVKMSKSDPLSSIFMEDEEGEVNAKIKNAAQCEPKMVEGNPCLEYVKYMIFPWFGEFKVERMDEKGGDRVYATFEDLVADYESGQLHLDDLKPSLAKAINIILQPVRNHFTTDASAKDLLKRVKELMSADSNLSEEVESFSIDNTDKNQTEASGSVTHSGSMDLEQKFQLVRGIGEECIEEDELRILLEKKPEPICYDGFEPSGRMHIAQGIMRAINVKKLSSAGCRVKILIADWLAYLNDKMGGDLEKIEVVGNYFIEIWKSLGMDLEGGRVEFLWSSQEIISRPREYLTLMMDIARRNKLPRIKKCREIMGRNERDQYLASQIIYPCMQCADIFFLKADICQLGMDQKEVNLLAREYCDDIKRKNKPIILSHHMLPGLKQGQTKMSKSDPSSSIFMDDEEGEVNAKIKNAKPCEPKIVEGNPCLEYVKYLIFPWFGEFKVERKAVNGGDKIYSTFEDLVAEYESGLLHPSDLKPSLAKAINTILQPVHNHFATDAYANDLLRRVKAYTT